MSYTHLYWNLAFRHIRWTDIEQMHWWMEGKFRWWRESSYFRVTPKFGQDLDSWIVVWIGVRCGLHWLASHLAQRYKSQFGYFSNTFLLKESSEGMFFLRTSHGWLLTTQFSNPLSAPQKELPHLHTWIHPGSCHSPLHCPFPVLQIFVNSLYQTYLYIYLCVYWPVSLNRMQAVRDRGVCLSIYEDMPRAPTGWMPSKCWSDACLNEGKNGNHQDVC